MEDVFASSTFWTEQSGVIAARLTLDRLKNWELFYKKLSFNSSNVRSCIINSFKEADIPLKINSLNTMISYKLNFDNFNERESSALLIDSLINNKYLTSSTIYPNICHTNHENNKFKKN